MTQKIKFNPNSKVFENAIVSGVSKEIELAMMQIFPNRCGVLLYAPMAMLKDEVVNDITLPNSNFINPHVKGLGDCMVGMYGMSLLFADKLANKIEGYGFIALHPLNINCHDNLKDFQKQITLGHLCTTDDGKAQPYWF